MFSACEGPEVNGGGRWEVLKVNVAGDPSIILSEVKLWKKWKSSLGNGGEGGWDIKVEMVKVDKNTQETRTGCSTPKGEVRPTL